MRETIIADADLFEVDVPFISAEFSSLFIEPQSSPDGFVDEFDCLEKRQ